MSLTKKENLIDKPLIDLKEMLERENKILTNKKFISKLKDKGEKIKRFRDEIEKVIKIKEMVKETESFLEKLSLGDKAILPKHPMFSVDSNDLKIAKQALNNEQQQKKNDAVKEILNEELDIFSVAISRTFDEELFQKRCKRFIPNRINKIYNDKEKSLNNQFFVNSKTENEDEKCNQRSIDDQIVADNRIPINKSQLTEKDQKLNEQNNNKDRLNQQLNQDYQKLNKNKTIFEKYKDTALEPFENKSKLIYLTIESSLELGKDQKVKDFEIEKIRLENRLSWRKIIEFDTDDSKSSDDDLEPDENAEDD